MRRRQVAYFIVFTYLPNMLLWTYKVIMPVAENDRLICLLYLSLALVSMAVSYKELRGEPTAFLQLTLGLLCYRNSMRSFDYENSLQRSLVP